MGGEHGAYNRFCPCPERIQSRRQQVATRSALHSAPLRRIANARARMIYEVLIERTGCGQKMVRTASTAPVLGADQARLGGPCGIGPGFGMAWRSKNLPISGGQ